MPPVLDVRKYEETRYKENVNSDGVGFLKALLFSIGSSAGVISCALKGNAAVYKGLNQKCY